jgi:hypothetical protein
LVPISFLRAAHALLRANRQARVMAYGFLLKLCCNYGMYCVCIPQSGELYITL